MTCEIIFELNVDICLKEIGFQLNAKGKNHILDPHIPSIQLIPIEQFSLAVAVVFKCLQMLFCSSSVHW